MLTFLKSVFSIPWDRKMVVSILAYETCLKAEFGGQIIKPVLKVFFTVAGHIILMKEVTAIREMNC